ncbi:MAG: NarK family nitrate/nitrite MFS transporter, partial [Actinomycetota bacterium]
MKTSWIEHWNPDDETFWAETGKSVAWRNLSFSVFAEFLGFAVWVLWSVTAVSLNKAGFDLTTQQLFTLVAAPALIGATARFPYTFAVARFGGRNWTVVSALLLLIPVSLLAFIVTQPQTPFWLLILAASTAGFGGGNFASSMANVSYFFPDSRKGLALGLNAAGGNIGVAAAQVAIPAAIGLSSVALIGGSQSGGKLFLQNAGLIWIPFILLAALMAWLFMDNLKVAQAPFKQQVGIFKRKHTWVMSWIYIGTFGSFIGYSAGLPLLMKSQFPTVGISIAFLGPLVGSLSRPIGGWLSDHVGGSRITFAVFLLMIGGVAGVIFFLNHKSEPYAFTGFVTMFVILFFLTGVGNGSTYRMIPMIYRNIHLGAAEDANLSREQAIAAGRRDTAAAVGFIGAIGAYGGWLIPQGYGTAASMTGTPITALYVFIAFYVCCLGLTWWYYMRSSTVAGRE